MNKNLNNLILGALLVILAAVLVCVLTGSAGDIAQAALGKAVWYFPYAALVIGVRRLAKGI